MNENNNDVLALFNGMSCGRIALDRVKIKYGNYYSSEIDKNCKRITIKNYPKTFELGDINYWQYWGIDFSSVGLILAGFPCQPWSVAGNGKGVEDLRGQLVYPLVKIWQHIKKLNPSVNFLFENVKMPNKKVKFINELFGMEPILINSNLVSAQNRTRYYWTNIPGVNQPGDKNIILKSIIEHGVVDREKSYCIDSCYHKGGDLNQYLNKSRRQIVFNYSSSGRGGGKVEGRHYDSSDKKAHTLTATGYTARSFTGLYSKKEGIRKLTVLECERLQTLPEGYTQGVSNTQRYKMIGNGWTIDVIAHILNGLK